MAQASGRRRNLRSERWIDYVVFFGTSEDGQQVVYASLLTDAVGQCPDAPSGAVRLLPDATAEETARSAVCDYVDTVPVSRGVPHPNPNWAARHAMRGGRF